MYLGIYGSGGLGREVYECAIRRNALDKRWKSVFFIDDYQPNGDFFGSARTSFADALSKFDGLECIVAVGEPSSRAKLFSKLIENDVPVATLVDPSATISPFARLGRGTIVMEYVTVKPNVAVSDNVLIQPFGDIGHDIKIGESSVLGPFFSPGGNSNIGDRVFVGMRACCLEGLTIGDDAIIAMGSAVFKNVPAGATVIGNPARITKGNDDGRVFRD